MRNLIDLLPPYYDNNQKMNLLQSIISAEFNNCKKTGTMVVNNSILATSDEMIDKYERVYGLEPLPKVDIKYRRERILARKRGQGSTTKDLIKYVAEAFSNGEVDVSEVFNDYEVHIIFTGTIGKPPRLQDLKAELRNIIPAHLGITYGFIYNTYAVLGEFKVTELHRRTYGELRNRRLRSRKYEEKL